MLYCRIAMEIWFRTQQQIKRYKAATNYCERRPRTPHTVCGATRYKLISIDIITWHTNVSIIRDVYLRTITVRTRDAHIHIARQAGMREHFSLIN